MPLSMTGHGQASLRYGDCSVDVEVRTVNNRYLKIVSKVSEPLSGFESELEHIVRDYLRRGSVSLSVRMTNFGSQQASLVNQDLLRSYLTEAKQVADDLLIPFHPELSGFLGLPGVVQPQYVDLSEGLLEAIKAACRNSLEDLQTMRRAEGEAMAAKFREYLGMLEDNLKYIASRSPQVSVDYQQRLEQRVRLAVESRGLEIGALDLLREITLFCDRSDISEERTRLASHVDQFRQALEAEESQGRRLEFLTQEMGREINTIGAKANDSEISTYVVAIKTILEQIRELVQNVE
jgi:uncharacterized protein (TIGR00255 family)